MHLSASSFATIVVLVGSVSACVGPAPERDDYDNDSRFAQEIKGGSPATAYPEALLVNMKQNGRVVAACSGALISPRVVLTAGHCVYEFDSWDIDAPNAASGQKVTASSGETLDWKSKSESVNPKMHDIGLIYLDSPILLSSYPGIAQSPLGDGSQVVNIGRIDNGSLSDTELFVSKPLTVHGGASTGYPLDYAANEIIESGDSGGPDMAVGTHTIVAVNSGAGGGSEVLARVDLVAKWIGDKVAAHGGGGGAIETPAPGTEPTPPGNDKPPAACGHALCSRGKNLSADCDPCVASICDTDPYCCNKRWDAQCVAEVTSVCEQQCK